MESVRDAVGSKKRTAEEISRNMSRIKSKDTNLELVLRRELWARGMRFRIHYSKVFGSPDIAFISSKVAVFCDSSFWHGNHWRKLKARLAKFSSYWLSKIDKNRKRDRLVNRTLKKQGWEVLRFWDCDICENTDEVVSLIIRAVRERGAVGA